MLIYTTSEGKTIELGDLLGIGGEGAVYKIRQSPYVVKILNAESLKSDKSREAKLKVMIDSHPFENAQAETKHTVAWPKALVYDEHKKFVGYTMPSILKAPELHLITNPSNRKTKDEISLQNLYLIAYNIAIIFDSLHKNNIVVGDISSKNILVNDDTGVAMVDCDSMQITEDNGTVYKCKVGTPEYTSPELHGKDLATQLRTVNHDCFGLAVIIFQLLMQGNNPFSGRQDIHDEEIVDLTNHCKINHIFPYDTMTPNKSIMVPLMAPDFEKCIPVNMQKLFKQAFTTDLRPTAEMWKKELGSALLSMTRCKKNPNHRHPQQTECTFCNWNQKQLNITGSIATLNQTPYVAPPFVESPINKPTAPFGASPTNNPTSPMYTANTSGVNWQLIWAIVKIIGIVLLVVAILVLLYMLSNFVVTSVSDFTTQHYIWSIVIGVLTALIVIFIWFYIDDQGTALVTSIIIGGIFALYFLLKLYLYLANGIIDWAMNLFR